MKRALVVNLTAPGQDGNQAEITHLIEGDSIESVRSQLIEFANGRGLDNLYRAVPKEEAVRGEPITQLKPVHMEAYHVQAQAKRAVHHGHGSSLRQRRRA